MEFKFLMCAQCHQPRLGNKMCYFKNCSHFFCYPCFGTRSACLKCNTGSSVDASKDDLLMSVLNFVSDVYSMVTDGLKIEEGPGAVSRDPLPLSEPKVKKEKDKQSRNDVAGTSYSTLRRGLRTKTLEIDKKPDVEKVIPPAKKRRRGQVSTESHVEDDQKVLQPVNEKLKTELTDLASPGVISKRSKRGVIPLLDSVKKNQVDLVQEQENNTNPDTVKKPLTEKLIQPVGNRRRRQAPTESLVLKTDTTDLTSPGITPKRNKRGKTPLHVSVKQNQVDSAEELENTADPNVPQTIPKTDADKLIQPVRNRQRRQVTAKSPGLKSPNAEELEPEKCKVELGNLTSPGITSKRNKRGETPLHVAVKKNKIDLVQELLETGADPNVQDFAGWTPLHDAVTKGFQEIITRLLKYGASADIPGYENETALHIAVEKLDKPLVATLLKHGASPVAKNLYGLTPKAVAEKSGDEQLINLLSSPGKSVDKPKVTVFAPAEPITLFISLLKNDQQALVRKFAKQFKFKIESDIYKASCVVTNPDPGIDWALARVMAKGSLIISPDWCEKTLGTDDVIQAMEKFLIYPKWLPGLSAAQNNRKLRRPGLFSGCEIKLGSSPQMLKKAEKYHWNDTVIDLNDLCRFVQAADGKLINRMPDPENPFCPNTVPYHVQPGRMERCSQIVVYFPGLWEPPIKFNMAHVKCLPIQWLMDCILSFELKDATDSYFTS